MIDCDLFRHFEKLVTRVCGPLLQGGSGRVRVELSGLAPGSLVVLSVTPVASHAAALQALQSLDMAALQRIADNLGEDEAWTKYL